MPISAFAHAPPDGNLVAELWDRFLRPGYRQREPIARDSVQDAEILRRFKDLDKQPTVSHGPPAGEEPEIMALSVSANEAG